MQVIFETVFGSHLYGTDTEKSDHDFKGVYVPRGREVVMPRIPDVKSFNTGSTTEKNTSEDEDRELYSVHKFFDMLVKGDMNAYEMLFAPGTLTREPVWDEVFIKHREQFLTRECKGFVGYARRQASLYGARGQRLNECQAVVDFLTSRAPISLSAKLSTYPNIIEDFAHMVEAEGMTYTSVKTIANQGRDVVHFECCDRMVPVTVSFLDAIEVYQRVIDNYGARARAAATNVGIDWKAVSHAVRIGEQAVELLVTGEIIFPRPNAKRLLAIKLGELPYAPISEELDFLLETIEQLSNTSRLPEKPNVELMESIREALYEDAVRNAF